MQGFHGNFAISFMGRANKAIEYAGKANKVDPFDERYRRRAIVDPPPFSSPPEPPPPFNEMLSGGSQRTGVGNSSNIVVEQSTYENVTKMADRVDDEAGAEIYKCCMEIEQMCQNTFVVPETISRILAITGQVKGSLGQFRSMTEEINIATRNFARNIIEADPYRGNSEYDEYGEYSGGGRSSSTSLAVSETAVRQASHTANMAMSRQEESMNRTSQQFNGHIPPIQMRERMERANAEREELEALKAAQGENAFNLFTWDQ